MDFVWAFDHTLETKASNAQSLGRSSVQPFYFLIQLISFRTLATMDKLATMELPELTPEIKIKMKLGE